MVNQTPEIRKEHRLREFAESKSMLLSNNIFSYVNPSPIDFMPLLSFDMLYFFSN